MAPASACQIRKRIKSDGPSRAGRRKDAGSRRHAFVPAFRRQPAGCSASSWAIKNSAELQLFRQQNDTFCKGDIFLVDKGLCSCFDTENLKNAESIRLLLWRGGIPSRQSDAKKVLGENDLLIRWKKPLRNKRSAYTHDQWKALPHELLLRQIHVIATVSGFRTESFYIITTLTDAKRYTEEELAELYLQRWQAELFFRDLKTTIGMDILRGKSPDIVEKEIAMHFIAYNCIRMLMFEAAEETGTPIDRISFKGAMQALRQWQPHFLDRFSKCKRIQMTSALYDAIASAKISDRSGRSEPRCKKRRPSPYQLLTKARHRMKETPHRGRTSAKRT